MNDRIALDPTFATLILAGGRSSRMGTDKACLPYRGAPLIEHMKNIAWSLGSARVLVGGGPGGDLPDPIAGAGPAASLAALAGLEAGPARWLVIPVDMPLLTPPLLQRLVAAGPEGAFFTDHPLPLALSLDSHTRGVLQGVSASLAKGQSISVRHILAQIGATAVTPTPGELDQLVNANTPDEWDKITREA